MHSAILVVHYEQSCDNNTKFYEKHKNSLLLLHFK